MAQSQAKKSCRSRFFGGFSVPGLVLRERAQLGLERALERGAGFASSDVRAQCWLVRDDIGMTQDPKDGRHNEITRGEPVFEVLAITQRAHEISQTSLHDFF